METAQPARRLEICTDTFYAWNAQLGPILDGKKLEHLALSFPRFSRCTKYSFRNNGIRKVQLSRVELRRLDMFTSVETLDLSENLLTCLDCQSLPCQSTKALDVSSNRLSYIDNIGLLWNLQELKLSSNYLRNLRSSIGRESLHEFLRKTNFYFELRALSLDGNNLSTLLDIGELVLMERLEYLTLQSNPLPTGHLIEGFVLLACPNLLKFNGLEVTSEVRQSIDRWVAQEHEGKEVADCVRLFREAFMAN